MYNILQIGSFPDELQARIDKAFQCHAPESVASDAGLRSRIEGIITRSNIVISEELISTLPHLKVISTAGVGYDLISVKFANDRGIIVTNTPGVLDAAVCELAVCIMLGLIRKLPAADRFVREGKWRTQAFPMATSLSGKAVGIVGLGRIGQGIASRLSPFGVDLLYSGSLRPQFPYSHFPDLRSLASAADILFVCVPGGAATRKLIDASVLEALGPEGFIINISRGTVVDESALIQALKAGKIKGAGLDVFNDEPDINPEFLTLPNIVLTPHLGSATQETREAMLRLALDNLQAVLSGASALTPVYDLKSR
jgi:lactate dehydrogenase-like 2-hydroxyacid dehydrogenase